MKKVVSILIALLIFAFSYQIVINFFIKHHNVIYSFKEEDNSYLINEYFKTIDNKGFYDFLVTDSKENKYFFSSYVDFNKQKQIIKKIHYYEDKNIQCILPIYKKDIVGEISCIYQNELVDYNYLTSTNISTTNMVNKFKNLGYMRNSWNNNESTTKEYNMTNNQKFIVYNDNILKNRTFAIWNYDGLFLISEDKTMQKKCFERDLYDNTNSTIVGKYYFMFNYLENDNIIIDVDYINLEDFGRTTITLPGQLTDNMYVNGVYKNILYVTDNTNKIQFAINPFKQNASIVGNKDKGYLVLKDGNLINISLSDYFKKQYYFNEFSVPALEKVYGNVEVFDSNNEYYFKTEDNTFYKLSKEHLDTPIKLFRFESVSEWKEVDKDIIILSGDTLYLYTEDSGIRPIVSNSEFKYNYKNICNLYKK